MRLSDPHRNTLRACSEQRNYSAGDKLLARGSSSLSLLLVIDGVVRLQRNTPYGDFVFDEIGPQGYLGEVLFCAGQARASDAVASESGTLWMVQPKALQMAMANQDGFEVAMLWQFWESLSNKTRRMNRTLERFFDPDAQRALAPTPVPPPRATEFDVRRRRETIRLLGLSNMEINFLASVADPIRLEPDQVLFREGEPSRSLYIVAEGRMMISKEIPGAGTEALAFVDTGGLLGEMGLVDDLPRCADAKAAAGGATLLMVRGETIAKVLHPGRASSVRLMRFLCRQQALRLQATYEKIVGWYILSGGSFQAR